MKDKNPPPGSLISSLLRVRLLISLNIIQDQFLTVQIYISITFNDNINDILNITTIEQQSESGL